MAVQSSVSESISVPENAATIRMEAMTNGDERGKTNTNATTYGDAILPDLNQNGYGGRKLLMLTTFGTIHPANADKSERGGVEKGGRSYLWGPVNGPRVDQS